MSKIKFTLISRSPKLPLFVQARLRCWSAFRCSSFSLRWELLSRNQQPPCLCSTSEWLRLSNFACSSVFPILSLDRSNPKWKTEEYQTCISQTKFIQSNKKFSIFNYFYLQQKMYLEFISDGNNSTPTRRFGFHDHRKRQGFNDRCKIINNMLQCFVVANEEHFSFRLV